jgi:hypothetical protein
MSSASMSKSQQRETQLSRKKAWDREHLKYPFWFGGSASCFAACVTHPLDLGIVFYHLDCKTSC